MARSHEVEARRDGGPKTLKSSSNARRRPRGPRKKQSRPSGSKDAGNSDDKKCRNCGRYGHWAKECRQPKRAQANLTQAEDDGEDPSLLMAQVCELSVAPAGVHLDDVLSASDDDVERLEGWYLDTGATNHMMGREDVFSDLDRSIVGSVKFGDGSLVSIKGRGFVIFNTKDGAHKVLTGVFIPRLHNNIVSLGQLDENGAKIIIDDGELRIWDRQQRLLTKVRRGANCLYVRRLDIARPVCLSARLDDDAWRWHDRASATSPSTRYDACLLSTWCAVCRSWTMSTSSAMSASPRSRAVTIPQEDHLPCQATARAGPRRCLRPNHTGNSWWTTLLPSPRRRSLPLHVGCVDVRKRRCSGLNRANSSHGGSSIWSQAADDPHRQWRRVHLG